MDLRDYIRRLTRRWRAVLAVLLLGTVTGYLAGHAEPPCYRATATLCISLPSADAHAARPDRVGTDAEVRARSYAAIATGPAVTGPVVRELKLPRSGNQLAHRISVDVPQGTSLVRISVGDPAPATAARIANAVARRLAMVGDGSARPGAGSAGPVSLAVTLPASVPTAPYTQHLLLDVVIGLLVGLALGLVLALLVDGSDAVLRTADALAAELDLVGGPPLLGTVANDGRVAQHPVAVIANPHGLRAQCFRRLRTNLRFTPSERGTAVLAVTSALPGEGRTAVAVNLAAALGEDGASVCLVDADLRHARVADTLGLVAGSGLTDVLSGQSTLDDVLQHLGTFTVLPSGPLPPAPAELLATAALRRTLQELGERFDHVLVDTGPLFPVADAIVLAPAVDAYLLVVRANRLTRRELARAVRLLNYTGTGLAGTVLNRAPGRAEEGSYRHGHPPRTTLPSPRAPRPAPPLLIHPCAPTTYAMAPMTTTESATP